MVTEEDEYGEYESDAGMQSPKNGRCNAKLKHWVTRYGEPRYCGQTPKGCPPAGASNFDPDAAEGFCRVHQYKKNWQMRAQELLQHGLYTKTREHLYDKCDPWDKLLMHGLHESLLDESIYEFAPEFTIREFDFSDSDVQPPDVDEDGKIDIEVAHATESHDRAKCLWLAAVDTVKALNANARIAEDRMEVESTEHAQLTSPTETNPSQAWKTIEHQKEHHLNLAYSRLIRDRKELLAYGGIQTGTEADVEENSQVIEEFVTITADPESVGEGSGMVDLQHEGAEHTNEQ